MSQPPSLGWIWPKDPRPGKPSHWPRSWRLRDIFTNRGPDIYVGVIGKKRSQTNWHRWGNDIKNPGDTDECDTPIPWARRGPGVRYDFRRRKYQVPDHGTWSKVEFCNGVMSGGLWGRKEVHIVPRRYWDRHGNEAPPNEWHNTVHGEHADR